MGTIDIRDQLLSQIEHAAQLLETLLIALKKGKLKQRERGIALKEIGELVDIQRALIDVLYDYWATEDYVENDDFDDDDTVAPRKPGKVFKLIRGDKKDDSDRKEKEKDDGKDRTDSSEADQLPEE